MPGKGKFVPVRDLPNQEHSYAMIEQLEEARLNDLVRANREFLRLLRNEVAISKNNNTL